MTETTREIVTTPKIETPLARAILHPAVERMLELSPTPETLREIMAMQREHEADVARKAYTCAIVALKRDLPPVLRRDSVVDYTSAKGRTHYRHTSLAHAMDTVTPMLVEHGFSLTWKPKTTDRGVEVTARLTHRDGHHEETTLAAPPDASGNKSTPQAIASTITLLERYTALALLGIATADMVEPKGEDGADTGGGEVVDAKRNLRACADIARRGRTREDAEAFAGRQVAHWTLADLDRLRAWVAAPAPPTEREFAHEFDREPAAGPEREGSKTESAEEPETSGRPAQSSDEACAMAADAPAWWEPKALSRSTAFIDAPRVTELHAACSRVGIRAMDLAVWLMRQAGAKSAPQSVAEIRRSTYDSIMGMIARIDIGEMCWRKTEGGWDFVSLEGPTS